jgi:hypothetical protein
MRLSATIVRLAALLVLISSVCDYCAFDLNDPEAPMSQPGPLLIVQRVLTAGAAAVRTSDLPDDHCLCCTPGIAAQPVTVQSPFLISSTVEHHALQPPIISTCVRKLPPRSQPVIL